MKKISDIPSLTLPHALFAEVEKEANQQHRPVADVLYDLIELGLGEQRLALQLKHHEPASPDEPMTDEYREIMREKIAQGIASAHQGKLVDGEAVFARIYAELDELERQERE